MDQNASGRVRAVTVVGVVHHVRHAAGLHLRLHRPYFAGKSRKLLSWEGSCIRHPNSSVWARSARSHSPAAISILGMAETRFIVTRHSDNALAAGEAFASPVGFSTPTSSHP